MNRILEALPDIDSLSIVWNKHALQRMLERSISREAVKNAIRNGKVIEQYLNDYPYPSYLTAYIKIRDPLHVVYSYDQETQVVYIITAYTPDTNHFENDLMTRKNNE